MKIGIIGAMKEEISYFQEKMESLETNGVGLVTFYTGTWNNHDVVISKCGVGKVNAAMTAQMMIDKFKVDSLIFTGVAGAINENLNVEDVVISTSSQQHDIDASALGFERGSIPMHDGPSDFEADQDLIEKAYQAASETLDGDLKVIKGKIVSGDQFIADKGIVRELGEQFNGDCVEMEGAAVAHIAYFNSIPFVIIRSISDKANGEAPKSFEEFVEKTAKTSAQIVERLLMKL
ncbi:MULTISPECIES: 5'-methylthioadenosine/adenosylhomocysteine nucleosidase [Bacillaceae]|uniref:adenosylhomocysteine nucleosidase n=1 Tax=Evansella alkalicola TaxID=745819 RepID=A0ABS6JRB5_9BACI|nr:MULTISPECIES: 5'-methylthioadenosine/adenosylhomocysteine nucleosidase [Bacillaceae]MBU9721099.1 5'-methylthioadenosine/adenosylhomocysteine nucleosidase [Bacillus alkalicola]